MPDPTSAAEPVAWDLAVRVATAVAGREPLYDSYLGDSLLPDFTKATALAERLVGESTGLHSLAGPARARVVDRADWVRANVKSFRRLLRPILERLAPRVAASPAAAVTRALAGVQVGTMLGWMSTRVLGQYDLLVVDDEDREDQDIVYYVGPNVLAIERRYAFSPADFRLWLSLHEVTHRAQFTGVSWMRPHFLSLVERGIAGLDADPRRFLEAMRRTVDAVRHGRNPLDDGGLVALLAGPEQHAVLQELQGLMSLLEGHGDVTMNRAGAGIVQYAERYHQTLHARRKEITGATRVLQQLLGLDAKMKQYEQGERFLAAVEAAGGVELVDRLWEDPANLPDLGEIRDPARWLGRVAGRVPQ